MSTRIVWRSEAFDEMSEIIQAHPERKDEFANALKALNLALTPSPEKAGESRESPYRVFAHGDGAFWFRPDPDQDEAHIIWVHLRRTRGETE